MAELYDNFKETDKEKLKAIRNTLLNFSSDIEEFNDIHTNNLADKLSLFLNVIGWAINDIFVSDDLVYNNMPLWEKQKWFREKVLAYQTNVLFGLKTSKDK